jgi:hypothetical protein
MRVWSPVSPVPLAAELPQPGGGGLPAGKVLGTSPVPSAADAVAKVGDATLSFENSDPLQLALFDAEVLEQPPPIAVQDRDQVDLELVEEPCGEGAPRGARPVDSTFLSPAAKLPLPATMAPVDMNSS